ncbi:L-aspartate oxidase [Salmonella enterica]|uniref:L-aspartate oxidase n=1 Tax=Salmonella enterica subsp. VII serovar 40:z4,z24:[z39] TaxID=1967625 RepID=A0A731TIA5_SALEE|nr:L-aspartate oxidase [Salmonella enterica]EDO5297590.1 L-aspartate oxidase [Salmonella enterica subsp. houtenae serovar 40:z4,z24:-]QUZ25576.1 L-aspartate oxidase [Salmonella enterica subsp. VII str. CFSAN000554]HAE4732987.1 L-aspartate oxidase [Salmonella enterica subsp. VII serovar 40:z4,z24:[z39]]HBZ8550160.1 L-aspartate oxidase [Salmonella enterica subsp. houtenae]HCA3677248.1 L-aspartate oxidase [Salmonella enterica subsp. houtenae serovar Houten]
MMTTPELYCDVLIIGSGAAGLSLALRLAEKYKVIVLSKGSVSEGSTFYAQGGIAAVFDETDSITSHVEDTLIAGAGICDRHAVEFAASNARPCVQWLIDQGVLFDTHVQPNGKESYHLTREGGHSHRRILHAADATGKEVETTLVSRAQNHSNIQVLERSNAVDLIISDKIDLQGARRVLGAWLWNRNKEVVETCHAKSVVLATGGASKVYQYTTNPDISSGDGIAMAWRAGCRVANLEFNQFHPTALYHPQARNFLLTEALRGEGAYLKRPDGTRFMPDFDERGELAPRDIVARAIDHEMKRLGADCMFLDISHKPEEFIRQHFPMIYEKLLDLGMDLTKEPIPVVPAAHYTCGGVVVDDYGRTDVDGLYAIGEVSYTGLHGANRMASNSLLECLVYGWSAAMDIDSRMPYAYVVDNLPAWDESRVENADELVVIQHNWHELRLLMWDYVGIVRTTKRLERALRRITMLQQEIDEYYANFRVSNNLLELRNLVQVAELIVRCAMMRKESRGLHFTQDYPQQLAESGPSILSPLTSHINR